MQKSVTSDTPYGFFFAAVPQVPWVASPWILYCRTSSYSSFSCVFERSVLRCEVDVVYMFEKTHKVAPI